MPDVHISNMGIIILHLSPSYVFCVALVMSLKELFPWTEEATKHKVPLLSKRGLCYCKCLQITWHSGSLNTIPLLFVVLL